MNIVVFGAGYVGLVQAAVLAELGNKVTCVDVSVERVNALKNGVIPIYEPGLSEVILSCVSENCLDFTLSGEGAIKEADIVFIAVGTPPAEDGSADLKYVKQVASFIAKHAEKDLVVVTKSTVPVSTGDQIEFLMNEILLERKDHSKPGRLTVVSNPEFLKEGSALNDCRRPDRIILGSDDEYAVELLKELYAPLNRNHDKIMVMGRRDAEFTKYAANCMLATKIAFINQMSQIAIRLSVDIENVRKGIGSDPRIGYHFIYPGCGYGGSCFPKDVSAMISFSQKAGVEPSILEAVHSSNEKQKMLLPELIYRVFGQDLIGKRFAVWGCSFKPNTDDMREAPSITLISELLSKGASVNVFDPEAMTELKNVFTGENRIHYCADPYFAVDGADALVVCTEWKVFQSPDFNKLKSLLNSAIVFDGRNLFNPDSMKKMGISYYAIARGESLGAL